ncbi:MAG: FtsW/RodA/SpoVE family cell cycle protein [Anaerolineales bacterium]
MNRVIQGNLLKIAAGFLFLQSVITTLAPAVWARSFNTHLHWSHWLAYVLWCLLVYRTHQSIVKRLPDADPYLFPAAALLTGWGLLTIWRLDPDNGVRQALWLAVATGIFVVGLRLPTTLSFVRKYKYVLLTSGILLTGLTLIFGTNPLGYGPRLWLGCCGFYFQPSEPLKLLLIAYLSAYLADWLPIRLRAFPLILPTLILIGLATMLLVFQRDLGTASIFIAIYTILLYLATERGRVLVVSSLLLLIVAFAGYYFVDIVRLRFNAWLIPWNDPGGGAYQIIQSLMAVANGGLVGRGAGLGNPEFVPVAISDFIYAAIAEETGLIGTIGLLALMGMIITRGLRVSLCAADGFRRFLSAGISAYFGIQAILIIGGNLRLLPLTGVTLPFISYGGSSLVTSFIALLFLLQISNHLDEEPAPLPKPLPYLALNGLLLVGLFAIALTNGWWSLVRGPDLLTRTDNSRRFVEDRYVPRGSILDRANNPININIGSIGDFSRSYQYPALAPVIGYNDRKYGQAGIEAVFDEYLRGSRGNPASAIWWDQLLYGMSPHGLDIRLSIDLALQQRADTGLANKAGAVVLLNAQSGEILAMASHPTFDPNQLAEIGATINDDPGKPLINRATQGVYPVGALTDLFAKTLFEGEYLNPEEMQQVYETFGLDKAPAVQLPIVEPLSNPDLENFHVSPLQVALAAAALSNHGIIPTPQIATAVNTPNDGWVVLSAQGKPVEAVQSSAADEAANSLVRNEQSYWSYEARAKEKEATVTWFIAGTPPDWQGTPLVVVVLLEEDNPFRARYIADDVLLGAINP